jgi:hypothetical protein
MTLGRMTLGRRCGLSLRALTENSLSIKANLDAHPEKTRRPDNTVVPLA